MTDRDTVLRTIDKAYAARIKGDKDALAAMCAPGARLELAGYKPFLAGYAAGPAGFAQTANQLIDLVSFEGVDRVDAVVEGQRAAVHWRAKLSVDGGEPFETALFDLWEVDREGKIVSLLQFADTARLRDELDKTNEALVGLNPA